MRIVFFTHYFTPEGNAPASRTYEHCIRWVKSGADITVITCAPNVPNGIVYEGFKNRIWPQVETIDGIRVIRVWTYLAANAGSAKRIANYLSYMISAIFAFLFWCRRPNLVVATSPQFFCGWAGVFASWLKWCKFVLEIRDIWPESIVTVGAMKKGVLTRGLEWLEKQMYRSANHIVAVGEGYKQNITSKVADADISVVTNGVDASVFQPSNFAPEVFRTRWNLTDKFVCSYVGTIGMAHGLEVTIEAAQRLKELGRSDIRFVLVGDGARRSELESLAAKQGVADYVLFTGRLPKESMPVVLAGCNCLLVHLKKSDLFETVIPSKIFEAMAMERPIIMGVRGESADIVKRSGAGIEMEPDNAADLVNAVLRLADDHQLGTRLCQNGREFVAEHYSRDVLAKRYLEILRQVAH